MIIGLTLHHIVLYLDASLSIFVLAAWIRADRLHEVALGDDPGPRRVRIQHHRGADLALGHQAGGLAQRVLRPDGEDHGAHPVTYLHATHSSLFSLATFAAMSTLAASEN